MLMQTLRRTGCHGLMVIALSAAGLPISARPARAQNETHHACYVPGTGTVYRVGERGLPEKCGASRKGGRTEPHVPFSWFSGSAGALSAAAGNGGGGGGKEIDHGGLVGLGDDDHPQYLLANGVRHSNGFALTGSLYDPIPDESWGIKLMWYPGKAAFRAGLNTTQWEDGNIGLYSVAMGDRTTAAGWYSVALGNETVAAGWGSIALGSKSEAHSQVGVAIGAGTYASGRFAVALGSTTRATGDYASAMGSNAHAIHEGSFAYGDRTNILNPVTTTAGNQFVVRAQRFWLGTNNNVTATTGRLIETSTGAYLSSGGAWVSSSDVAKKTAFDDVDAQDVLTRLAALPIRTWSYREEDASVRHIGPTAQDFHAAFGLGDTDRAIAGIDADGVSFAAIQALEKQLRAQQEEIAELRARLARLEAIMDR